MGHETNHSPLCTVKVKEEWSNTSTPPTRLKSTDKSKFMFLYLVHSVEQKSIGVIFHTSHSGSDVRYSSHHNSSRFTFLIFVHSWRFSVFHSLQSITPPIQGVPGGMCQTSGECILC